jgi:transcriptional regulator with XRE-family HTH domain
MENTVKQRLKKFIKSKGISERQFCLQIGASPAFVANIVQSIQPNRVNSIANQFPDLNTGWLLTGEGEMLKNSALKSDAREKEINEFVHVPMVPVRAKAGYLIGYGDQEYVDTLPTIPVITDRTFHGKYRCFEVEGDSMDDGSRDALCDRDVVLCREIRRDLWQYKLHINDWDFVIVHKEGILIKRIVEHHVDRGTITCHSLNPMFGPDFTVNLLDVYELYNVLKIVDRSTRR